jgi:SAM-dependent methyltransferase
MIRRFYRGVAGGKSILRTLVNERCRGVKVTGDGLDLGSGGVWSSHYGFMDLSEARITHTDLYRSGPGVVALNLEEPFPLESGSQDFALLFHVLYTLYHPQVCLAEARRVLRPGGRLIGAVAFQARYTPDPVDYYRFSGPALERLLADAGFQEITVERVGVGPFTASAHMLWSIVRPNALYALVGTCAYVMDRMLARLTRRDWGELYPLAHYFEAVAPAAPSANQEVD